MPSVFVERSPSIEPPHPQEPLKRGREERVADDEVRVVRDDGRPAEVREEEQLEQRRDHEHRDGDPRVEPAEERAVARQAPSEEDA
jgi:hypothetical protein